MKIQPPPFLSVYEYKDHPGQIQCNILLELGGLETNDSHFSVLNCFHSLFILDSSLGLKHREWALQYFNKLNNLQWIHRMSQEPALFIFNIYMCVACAHVYANAQGGPEEIIKCPETGVAVHVNQGGC